MIQGSTFTYWWQFDLQMFAWGEEFSLSQLTHIVSIQIVLYNDTTC